MESKHIYRNANVSIRKVREMLPGLKQLSPTVALQKLDHMPHSAARALTVAIKTAISNATFNLKVTQDMLKFRNVFADQGLVLKRYRAGSRGSPLPIKRKMTHITVVLHSSTPVDVIKPSSKSKKSKVAGEVVVKAENAPTTEQKKEAVQKTQKKVTKSRIKNSK